jgi:DNA replication protein DnaC
MTPNPFAEVLERLSYTTRRDCVRCGDPFTAIGMLAYCEACDPSLNPDALPPAPKTAKVEFADCWPKRAIRALDAATGPAISKAVALYPKTKEGLLLFIGDRGTGKTVMSAWMERERQRNGGKPGTYVKAHNIFEAIKRSWHPQTKEIESDVISKFRRAPFLVIDEAQERSEGEWENRTLVNIVDHRYDSLLPTVIIANLKAAELNTCLGPSIIRRATETGGLVECNWPSYV